MFDLLKETLVGDDIVIKSGQTQSLNWFRPAAGIVIFDPKADSDKSVVISVAVHGNETAPIEIVTQLVTDLLTEKYQLKVRLMIMIGNLQAMRQGQRYLSIDMNRLFSDHYLDHPTCYETQRAQSLQQIMSDFYCSAADNSKFHFDLHTAIRGSLHRTFALLPYLKSGDYHQAMLDWLQSIGLEALVINHAPAATFSYFSSNQFGAASCTLELGKAKPFGDNDLQEFTGIQEGLLNLITAQQANDSKSSALQIYKVAEVIVKSSDKFTLNVADDVKNFTPFAKGYNLSTDGHIEQPIQQETGYILFPNNKVKVGFRAALLLAKGSL